MTLQEQKEQIEINKKRHNQRVNQQWLLDAFNKNESEDYGMYPDDFYFMCNEDSPIFLEKDVPGYIFLKKYEKKPRLNIKKKHEMDSEQNVKTNIDKGLPYDFYFRLPGVNYHDNSRMSKKNQIVCDLIKNGGEIVYKDNIFGGYKTYNQFQSNVTLDHYQGKLYINGEIGYRG